MSSAVHILLVLAAAAAASRGVLRNVYIEGGLIPGSSLMTDSCVFLQVSEEDVSEGEIEDDGEAAAFADATGPELSRLLGN